MFKHLFIYKLKVLLKSKAMLFWTMIFPFLLGTFFYLALSNIDKAFEFKVIPLAVVTNENYQKNENFKKMIDSLSKDDNKLFETKYVSLEEAKNMLEKAEIDGYIIFEEDKPKLVIKQNGINQTIIKYSIDEYYQMTNVATQMIEYDAKNLYNGALSMLYENSQFVTDTTSQKIDFSINYFFTLIAMTCMYGSLIGLEVIKDSEANLSQKGARVCVSPVNKMKIVLTGLAAGYLIQVIALGLLFVYLIFVLRVNFASKIIPTIVLSMIGCLSGTSFGTFVGVSNKKKEGFKIGIIIVVVMSCCFFSGMMGTPSLKASFDEKLSLFAKVNPVNMIVDGLYSLFAYDTLDVYYSCLLRISFFSILLILATFLFVRRKDYDSI